ncbi:MAG: copper amine oxidase N-terminal domain-containing protein [Defluviitaleaceae bacterium]|nr:copper amine oxidase N-terminal domain-containing protein [Defluviitaleaceae bacterium]
MKKYLKLITIASIAALLAACNAATPPETAPPLYAPGALDSSDNDVTEYTLTQTHMPEFSVFKGTITEITPLYGELRPDGEFIVLAEGNSEKMRFIIDQDTLVAPSTELEVGMKVAGVYETIFQYLSSSFPPLVPALALLTDYRQVMANRFDENFLNIAGDMFINISDYTEIIFQDGTPFDGDHNELIGRALVVTYTYVLESLPGRTTADKIIVLFERAVPPIHYFTEEELAALDTSGVIQPDFSWDGGLLIDPEDLDIMWDNMLDPETVQIIINGETIDAPTPFVNRDAGFVMVPVAYIAEILGYQTYLVDNETLMIGRSTIAAGIDNYHYNRMAPVELGTAPEIHDNTFFVPLHFFGHVFPAVGYMQDGNVIITDTDLFDDIND